MKLQVVFATVVGFIIAACADGVQLMLSNYNDATEGKTVFVKCFVPWCPHCQEMGPAWNKLEEYGSEHVNGTAGLIGEVDCSTDDGKALCDEMGIEAYPTILWGDPLSLDTYEGPRDEDSLMAFAHSNVFNKPCSVTHLDFCTGEQKLIIKDLRGKSLDELEAIVSQVQEAMEIEEAAFQEKLEKLQQEYAVLAEAYNGKMQQIQDEVNYQFVDEILTEAEEQAQAQAEAEAEAEAEAIDEAGSNEGGVEGDENPGSENDEL